MNKEWGFGLDGSIVTDQACLERYKEFGYLLIHLPSGKAFHRSHLFMSEDLFKWCIQKWNEDMPTEWLHIGWDDIEGWDLVR